MKRKVVKHGPSSLTVSLPAKWVHKNDVKAGDELDIEETGSKLCLGKDLAPVKKRIELNFSKLGPRHIKWILQVAYKEGYDEIRVEFDEPSVINMIEHEMTYCPGLEIMEQSENSCMIKNIAKNLEDEFERALRRNFLNSLSMIELFIKKIRERKLNELKELIKFEETNNKLTSLCERMININKSWGEKAVFAYMIVAQIERVVDEYKYMCEYFSSGSNSKTKISEDIIQLLEDAHKMFRRYYELYYSFSLEKQVKITDLYKEIREKAYHLMITKKGNEIVMLHHLTRASEKILECLSSTFALNTESFETKQ